MSNVRLRENDMPFTELMNDNIELLKKDGSKTSGLKASVQKSKIYMDAGKLLVESGDLIIRKMSNGAEDTYKVIDPGFYEEFGGIPANYQMDVAKLGLPEAKREIQHITYNITGNNARVNQNSIDQSNNVIQIDNRIMSQISMLRQELVKLNIPEHERQSAYEIVDELESQFRSGKPKRSIVTTLLASLPKVANIATIASTILSLLKI